MNVRISSSSSPSSFITQEAAHKREVKSEIYTHKNKNVTNSDEYNGIKGNTTIKESSAYEEYVQHICNVLS